MKALIGFTGAIILSCIPLYALAQNMGGSVAQGAGSAAMGAANQAGANAVGHA